LIASFRPKAILVFQPLAAKLARPMTVPMGAQLYDPIKREFIDARMDNGYPKVVGPMATEVARKFPGAVAVCAVPFAA
jgi:hypothetical protein